MESDECKTFRKRSGCTDRGKDYEHLYIASLILKLVIDNTVRNFYLSSNDDSFGAFDDVVLEIDYVNGNRQIYAMQLKHIGDKTLTKQALAEKKGKFGIRKYFDDFTKLPTFADPIKFVLFTNLKCQVPNGVKMALMGDDFDISFVLKEQETVLGVSPTGRCYQFSASGTIYEDFFAKFCLYTGQSSVDKLRADTMTKFREVFKCNDDSFEQYVQFVTQWSLKEGKKDQLNKILMKKALAVRLVGPCMIPLVFAQSVNDKTKLFTDAMSKFQVTVFEECQARVKTLYTKCNLDTNCANQLGRRYQITSKYVNNIDDLSDEECSKLLWLSGACPLLLIASETVNKVIELCHSSKFVVFGSFPRSANTFKKLTDLDQDSPLLKKLKCSFQGKEDVALEFLNPKIREILTTNELVQMLDDSFKIGGKKEILPIPHIDRSLTRNIVSTEYLNKIDEETLIVISGVARGEDQLILNSSLTKLTVTRLVDFWKTVNSSEKKKGHQIFVTEDDCLLQQLEDVCRKIGARKYHQFRIFGDGLEWVRSQGGVSELREFRTDNSHIEQMDLFGRPCDNKVNIVCADPGMGKTILMKNLKNFLEVWTILIQPKDHSKYFRDRNSSVDDFIKYIVSKSYKDSFVCEVVHILVKECQVVFIWDGLDEVINENLKVILEVIGGLAKRGFTQWLTSRCNLMKTLEDEFSVLSRTVEQFDVEQQNSYIERRLNGGNLTDIKEKIHNCIKLVQYNDILGIPLQIYMLTDLFRRNPDKYRKLLTNIFSITDLYRHFVDEKFAIYHEEKAELEDTNDVVLKIMEGNKNERLRQYEEVALKTYLRPEALESLRINCDHFLESIQKTYDSVGIIIDVTDDKIVSFLHNSYGEYFAASYLSKNYNRFSDFRFIFEEAFNNIRFLFDLLMAESRPAHIAVLYKNLEVLEKYESELGLKDKGGRNPLQIACSWGRRFSFHRLSKEGDSNARSEEVKEDTTEYQKMMVYLSERCDPLEVDDLFKMDSFYYADYSCSLLPILVLSNKHQFDFAKLINFSDVNKVLYNAVRFDYSDVFEDIPFVTIDKEESLLHLAVIHGSVNCLRKMLANPEYLHTVNIWDRKGVTPFLLACRSGHIDIIKLLMAAGADITATTITGYNAIYVASQAGHSEVIQLLLNAGLDIDTPNESGKTPFHLACDFKNLKMAQLLIDFGADIDKGDTFGFTALYMACRHKHKETIQFLLEHSANVNVTNTYGDRPLFIASWNGELDTVKLLLDAGADIDCANKKGHAAIHAAYLMRNEDVLDFLIRNGADIDKPNKFGQTPLHLCTRQSCREGILMLQKARADIERVNKYGEDVWPGP